jgi:hypothetical protein
MSGCFRNCLHFLRLLLLLLLRPLHHQLLLLPSVR